MPSPKKRKVRRMIGRVLAKGQTMTYAAAVADDLDNILNIGLWGHDSTSAFTQGATSLQSKDSLGTTVPHNDGLETLAQIDARMNQADWDTKVAHYYLSNDTSLEGLAEASPATADFGILYSPEGPGAKMVPSLEDVSAGDAIKFWVKPTGWTGGQNIRYGVEMNMGTAADTIKVYQGDDDTLLTTLTPDSNGDKAADVNGTIAHHAKNNDKGIYFQIEIDSNTATAQKGFHIFWEKT